MLQLGASLFFVSWSAGACAPSPRNVPCQNDGQCETANADFKFCAEARCVECLSPSACGEGNACVDGQCVAPCTDDKTCASGRSCKRGNCSRY